MARGVHVRIARTVEFIAIWSGSIATIPSGLRLCDGSNGTPDLRDRFVKAAHPGVEELLGIGGSDTATLAHRHTYPSPGLDQFRTDPESAHTHADALATTSTLAGVSAGGLSVPATLGDAHVHPLDATSTRTVAHHHALDGATADDARTFDNRPPWYALAYVKGANPPPAGMIALYDRSPATLARFTAGATTALAGDVGAVVGYDNWAVTVGLGIATPFRAYVGGETVRVLDTGGDDVSWFLLRGQDGTTPVAHLAGAQVALPRYAICDGANGTSNLTSQFVVGAGGRWPVGHFFGLSGPQGGPPHSHDVDGTLDATSHQHAFTGTTGGGGGTTPATFPGPAVGGPHFHEFGGLVPSPSGSHAHTLTPSTGTTLPTFTTLFDPTPRYVSLYYVKNQG